MLERLEESSVPVDGHRGCHEPLETRVERGDIEYVDTERRPCGDAIEEVGVDDAIVGCQDKTVVVQYARDVENTHSQAEMKEGRVKRLFVSIAQKNGDVEQVQWEGRVDEDKTHTHVPLHLMQHWHFSRCTFSTVQMTFT